MDTGSGKPTLSRRRFLHGAAGVLGASILAACGGATSSGGGATSGAQTGGSATAAPAAGGQAQVTIDLWDQQTGIAEEATKKIISDFEAKNPGIKINRTYIAQTEGTQADQKLLTAIAGGNPPDVYKFDRFIVSQFAAQDFLTDLTDLASKGGVKADDYYPFAWEEANYKGKLFALPFDTDTRQLWYNKDMFKAAGLDPEKPPQNIKELADFSDKLTKKDSNGRITTWGFVPHGDQAWIYTYGFGWQGVFQDKDSLKITTANPKVVEAMKWLGSYAAQLGVDNIDAFTAACTGTACNDANDYFWTGQAAMVVSGNWKVSQAKKYKPDVQYGVAPFPGPDGPAPFASWAGGWSWVVPKGAKHPEEAWKAVSYICGPEGQNTFCQMVGNIPTNKQVAADPFYSKDPLSKAFIDLLPVSHTRPPIPAGSLLWDELYKARADILHGKDPEATLKAVDDKVNAELEKLNFFKK
jgi:multiple sugar transport system substrate-binding protein